MLELILKWQYLFCTDRIFFSCRQIRQGDVHFHGGSVGSQSPEVMQICYLPLKKIRVFFYIGNVRVPLPPVLFLRNDCLSLYEVVT